MRWDLSNYPDIADSTEMLVLHKAIEIANDFDIEKYDEEYIIMESRTQAEEWYNNASEEEKKEYRKRYPENDN